MLIKEKILGVDTEILFHFQTVPIIKGGNATIIVFIGGNPGTLYFYEDFVRDLYNRMLLRNRYKQKRIYACAVGHANHHLSDGKENPAYENYNLEFQIQHKLEFFKYLMQKLESHGEEKECVDIKIIAHSIGSYIALTILARSIWLSNVTQDIILLMPFIRFDNLPRVHRYQLWLYNSLLPISHTIVASPLKIITQLPKPIRKLVLASLTGLSGSLLSVVSDRLLTPRLIDNFLVMGSAEIEFVQRDQHRVQQFIQKLVSYPNQPAPSQQQPTLSEVANNRGKAESGETVSSPSEPSAASSPAVHTPPTLTITSTGRRKRLMVLYTDDDKWAPSQDGEDLQAAAPELYKVFIPGLTHGFTVHNSPSGRCLGPGAVEVSKRIVDFIALQSGDSTGSLILSEPRARL